MQLVIGWVPVGVLIAVMVLTAHPLVSTHQALAIALRMILVAGALGVLVFRLTQRWPWPDRLGVGFVLKHCAAGVVYAVAVIVLNSVVDSLTHRHVVVTVGGAGLGPFFVVGMWFYVMVAGVSYANEASGRAARAEALAAKSQLAALRAQLNPHFLFNALHTVVQLIPSDPARASTAAEQVAGLLRTTLEENRDLVPLDEELSFVRRYLGVERIRFGDRLAVDEHVSDDALGAMVPVFSVQTLVENAVRHGAAPRVDQTTIVVSGQVRDRALTVTVHDTGDGSSPSENGNGTGLARLRERLAVLYGGRARLELTSNAGAGFTASFSIPFDAAE